MRKGTEQESNEVEEMPIWNEYPTREDITDGTEKTKNHLDEII
jgi:hypothetical protein